MNKEINFTLPAEQPNFKPEPLESIAYLEVGSSKALTMLFYPREDVYKILYVMNIYHYNFYGLGFKDKEKAKSKFLELAEELIDTGKLTGFKLKENNEENREL